MRCYCIYCKTGAEPKLAKLLSKVLKEAYDVEPTILFPVRIVHEKHRGQWLTVEQPLLPGYMFLYLDDEEILVPYLVKQERDVYKVLRNTDGTLPLKGSDEKYAMWVWRYKGRLEPSRVVFEKGHHVKVLGGPLADMEGRIVKIDRHHKRAVVAFMFAGVERTMNLSIEAIELAEGAGN
jgi:transcription antitermination factor NusG